MNSEILKQSSRRSVRREGDEVVKRFHDPEPGGIGRLRDRLRAAREFRRLRRLEALGFPVPSAIERRDGARGPEVVTGFIAGARPLEDVLRDDAARAGRTLERCAVLLARLHARGALHGDLHPGNVIIDEAGSPVLVDAAAVRFGLLRPTPSARRERDLAQLCGSVREWLDAGLRARFLVRYLDAFAPAAGVGGAAWAAERRFLQARLEERARDVRRESVTRHAGRWLRPSSRCRAADGARAGRRVLFVREVDDDLARELRYALDECGAEPQTLCLPGPPLAGRPGVLDVSCGPPAAVRARFRRAGVLCDHAVPAARPLALAHDASTGRSTAVLARPADWRRIEPDEWPGLGPPDAMRLGQLAGTLWDRGYAPAEGARPWLGTATAGLGVSAELVHRPTAAGRQAIAEALQRSGWLALAAALERHPRRAFALGFAHASREGPGHRAALLAALEVALVGRPGASPIS